MAAILFSARRTGRLSCTKAGISRLRASFKPLAGTISQGIPVPATEILNRLSHRTLSPGWMATGALLMRPLLLHASSAAEAPGHRRVIHLEYAVDPLPDGLAWYHDRPLHPSEGGTP